eukprot:14906463-Ditylum_brightwellii.AAC.1
MQNGQLQFCMDLQIQLQCAGLGRYFVAEQSTGYTRAWHVCGVRVQGVNANERPKMPSDTISNEFQVMNIGTINH